MIRNLIAGMLVSFVSATAAPTHTVVEIDATTPDLPTWVVGGLYEIPREIRPAEVQEPRIIFSNQGPLRIGLGGLQAGADYLARLEFLADGPRVLAVAAGNEMLIPRVEVPAGRLVTSEVMLPAAAVSAGVCHLSIGALEGANPVLHRLHVLSSHPAKLRPAPREDRRATPAMLETMAAERPVLPPLPQAIAGVDQPVISLDGSWEFRAAAAALPKPIQVPGEWAMQGFTVRAGEFASYRRMIEVPADWDGGPVGLRFDAVHAECSVAVNGKPVGTHHGGFVPFELDASAAIRAGGENEIIVRVRSESVSDTISCISQYAAHPVGGIVRKVRLVRRPALHVAGQRTSVTVSGDDAILRIETSLRGPTAGGETVVHRLFDPAGKLLGELPATDGRSEFLIPKARLWTSETPDLHRLETLVLAGGVESERMERKVGLREIAVVGQQVRINGRPVKLLGVNRHEVHPLSGRSLTPELCRRDAELFREANLNLVRTSHYPPSEEFLDACDELGLFVECEAAVCWIDHHASPAWRMFDSGDAEFFPHFLRAGLEMVAAYRHHPSVILWSPANESRWGPHFAAVTKALGDFDPTRPVVFHDQSLGDFNNQGSTAAIANYHYPSPEGPAVWSTLVRPLWFGEYAHVQCYNRRELTADPGVRDQWGEKLAPMIDLMWQEKGCLGGAIWSGIDDVFHMPGGDLRGYGHWGIIDGWRRQKPEFHGVFMASSPLRVLERQIVRGSPVKLRVQNRFNFTDLAEVRIAWEAAGQTGELKARLAPHAVGELEFPITAGPPGWTMKLTVTDRRDVVVAREVIQAAGEPVKAAEMEDRNEEVGARLDAAIRRLGLKDRKALVPLPMLLPLNADGGSTGPAGTVLANVIEPFTPYPSNGKIEPAAAGAGTIVFKVETDDAAGTVTLSPGDHGHLRLQYAFTVKKAISPRQWGVVFTLPADFDTIRWKRRGYWSWYPASSIARLEGVAKALPVRREMVEEPGKVPQGPWESDANALGTADFRSTKTNIWNATLSAADGRTLGIVSPDASQAVRTWVDGECIRLLVAPFVTGGSEKFFESHYQQDRRPLREGDSCTGTFEVSVSGF